MATSHPPFLFLSYKIETLSLGFTLGLPSLKLAGLYSVPSSHAAAMSITQLPLVCDECAVAPAFGNNLVDPCWFIRRSRMPLRRVLACSFTFSRL